MCVYQSLMMYIINLWSENQDEKCSEKLQKLFSKYNYILEAIEVIFIVFSIFHNVVYFCFYVFKASEKTNKKKTKKNKADTGTISKFTEPAIHLDFNVLYKFLSLLM